MIAQVSSLDEHQDLVVDARTMNEGDGWAGSGSNPWRLDSGTSSILFLTDESGSPARIGLDVTAGGVHYYLIRLTLAPHETRAIDLRALRDSQVPDFKGDKIPASAAYGSVNWVRLDSVPVEGRMMVIQQRQGMASSYDCASCPCPAGLSALNAAPDLFSLPPGSYEDIFGTGTYYDCNGYQFYIDVTYSIAFSSSNTSVIKMDSSVHNKADAIAAGTSTITETVVACTMYDTDPDLPCPCTSQRTFYSTCTGNVTPEILRGGCSGTNITGTTQTATTGQQVVLCGSYGSLPLGVSVTSQSWTVGGTTVGGWTVGSSSGGYTGTNFSQKSTTFYWLAAANSLQTKFTLTLSNGFSSTVSSTFHVAGPTGVSATATPGHWEIIGGNALALGSNTVGDFGIRLNSNATSPSGDAGTYEWAQFITDNAFTVTAGGTSTSCSYGTGLDTRFPAGTGLSFVDSPSEPLQSSWSKLTWSLAYKTYLMWDPELTNSIPVPLGSVSWQAFGDAAQNNNTWTVQSDSSASTGTFQASSSPFTNWSSVAPTSSCQ